MFGSSLVAELLVQDVKQLRVPNDRSSWWSAVDWNDQPASTSCGSAFVTATLANGTNTEMEEYKKVATFMLRFEGRNEMEGSSKHKDEKEVRVLKSPL